jgi:hypothetical protein
VLVRHDGEDWYVCALSYSCAERIAVQWMSSARAEAVAVGRWLARGLAPSELLIHRRDDSLLRIHRYAGPRTGVRRRRERQWNALRWR